MEVYRNADSPDPYYSGLYILRLCSGLHESKKYDVANEYLQKVINLNIKMYGEDYEGRRGYVLLNYGRYLFRKRRVGK